MAHPDVEDALEAVRQFFLANFPTALQAVDSAKTNPLNPQAPDPQAYYFGDMPNIPLYPCLVFASDNTKVEVEEHGYREQLYNCFIEGYASADDVQNLSRVIRRYGAAIDNLLNNNPTIGGACNGLIKNVHNVEQKYWATLKQQGGLYQAVRVTFDLRVITD
jgi:hypothetical protein